MGLLIYPTPNMTPVDTIIKPVKEVQELRMGVLSATPHRLGTNCVFYARSKTPIPRGLWTLQQKINQIKSYDPEIGAVGVTAESRWGHVVIVIEIEEETLVISEGNYYRGYETLRRIKKDKIIGYL